MSGTIRIWWTFVFFIFLWTNGKHAATANECPTDCHCLPLPSAGQKINCHWPGGVNGLKSMEAFKRPTQAHHIQIRCRANAGDGSGLTPPSTFAPNMFARFPALQHLHFIDCPLSHDILPSGLFNGLHNLRTLHFENTPPAGVNQLQIDSGLFSGLEKIEKLTLTGMRLRSIPGGALCHLKELKMLNLSGNHFGRMGDIGVTEEPADCKTHIISLDMSRNQIRTFAQGDMANLDSLHIADFKQNDMEAIGPNVFGATSKLRAMDLEKNRLSDIRSLPPALQTLNLAYNSLTILPSTLADYKASSLMVLNVSHNQLDPSMPFYLSSPTLSKVDLSHNHLTQLPPQFFANTSGLVEINLAGNGLQRLTKESQFAHVQALRKLDLSNNEISEIQPSSVPTGIHELRLDNNSMTEVTGELLDRLVQLKQLNLAHNLLLDIPPQLFKLYHMSHLDLSHNRISEIHKFLFDKLPNLRQINLAWNKLNEIERYTLEDMKSLDVIDLSSNSIAKLSPHCFTGNDQLARVQLSGNLISDIADVFRDLVGLKLINLTDNAVTFLDYSMLPVSLNSLILRNNYVRMITNIQPNRGIQLRSLDVSYNNLTFINPLSLPYTLEMADFQHNNIHQVETQTLRNKTQLKTLNLQDNAIRHIERSAFEIGHHETQAGVELSGNDMECSCQMEWMQKMDRGVPMAMPRVLDYDQIRCTQPHTGKTEYLRSLDRSQLLCQYEAFCSNDCPCCNLDFCDCNQICPVGCTCYHDSTRQQNIVECRGKTGIKPEDLPMFATQIYLDGTYMPIVTRMSFFGRLRLRQLYLNKTGIQEIEKMAFKGLTSLELLDLSDNEIGEINGKEFQNLPKLTHLFLNGNQIQSLKPGALKGAPNLKSLTLRNNQFRKLPTQVSSKNLYAVTLGGNPWYCDCGERFWIQKWLPKNVERVEDSEDIYCSQELYSRNDSGEEEDTSGGRNDSRNIKTILSRFPPTHDNIVQVNFWKLRREMNGSLCSGSGTSVSIDTFHSGDTLSQMGSKYLIGIVAGIIAISCLLLVCVSCLVHRFCFHRYKTLMVSHHSSNGSSSGREHHLSSDSAADQHHMSAARIRKGPPSLNSSATTTTPVPLINYDAFVTYALDDSDWVQQLAERLEYEPPEVRLCLLYRELSTREFSGYHLINDDISNAMRRSQLILIILSASFLANEWESVQVKTAIQLAQKSQRLIFIRMDSSDLNRVDPILGHYIRTCPLIDYPRNPIFWEQLRGYLEPLIRSSGMEGGSSSLPYSSGDYSDLDNYAVGGGNMANHHHQKYGEIKDSQFV